MVEAKLHSWFDERCVEPRFQQIVLPSLWPRKRNTRGGDEVLSQETAVERDLKEEARREVEAESMARRERDLEGLRRRGIRSDHDYEMPGTMLGTVLV